MRNRPTENSQEIKEEKTNLIEILQRTGSVGVVENRYVHCTHCTYCKRMIVMYYFIQWRRGQAGGDQERLPGETEIHDWGSGGRRHGGQSL